MFMILHCGEAPAERHAEPSPSAGSPVARRGREEIRSE